MLCAGLAFAHGTNGGNRTVGAPHPTPTSKFAETKYEALQYCDSNEFIELMVGTLRILMCKAATNNIFSNKHKA
jgi:hypothetical protein